MGDNNMKKAIFIQIINSMSEYVSACLDNQLSELKEYLAGRLAGQLNIACSLKLITGQEFSDAYISILGHQFNYNCIGNGRSEK